MNIRRAFSFMFEDKEWFKKIGIGGLFFIIPVVGPMFCLGYFREFYHSAATGRDVPLPEWENLGEKLVHGFKLFLALLIYTIPVYILYFLLLVGMIWFASAEEPGMILWLAGAAFVLIFLYLFYWISILPAIMIIYFQSDSISMALSPVNHWRFIRQSGWSYWFALLLGHVAFTLSFFGLIICFVGICFTFFWANLTFLHLYAQCEKGKPQVSVA